MKAVVIDRFGGLDQLSIREMPRPEPGVGEVLIRVQAAGVNPLDWKIRQGQLRLLLGSKFPKILGVDVAGEVSAVGSGVSQFRVSDPVFALLNPTRAGGYAEYVVAQESAVAKRPEGLSAEDAAALPVAGLTALQSLRDLGELAEGQALLVNGASGGVGTFAVQIGKILGAEVVGVCRGCNAELVRGLGADEVIDYTREDFTSRPAWFDVVLDAVAQRSFSACSRVLSSRGTYISTLPGPGLFFWMAAGPLAGLFGSKKRAKLIVVKKRGEDLDLLARWVVEGKLRPLIEQVFPLEAVREAHERSESGRVRGKIVLRVS